MVTGSISNPQFTNFFYKMKPSVNNENHWPEYVSNHHKAPISGNGYSIEFLSKRNPGNSRGDNNMVKSKAMQDSGEEPGTTETKLEKKKSCLSDFKFCNSKYSNSIKIYEAPSIYTSTGIKPDLKNSREGSSLMV